MMILWEVWPKHFIQASREAGLKVHEYIIMQKNITNCISVHHYEVNCLKEKRTSTFQNNNK
jgi:hypothetical protein